MAGNRIDMIERAVARLGREIPVPKPVIDQRPTANFVALKSPQAPVLVEDNTADRSDSSLIYVPPIAVAAPVATPSPEAAPFPVSSELWPQTKADRPVATEVDRVDPINLAAEIQADSVEPTVAPPVAAEITPTAALTPQPEFFPEPRVEDVGAPSDLVQSANTEFLAPLHETQDANPPSEPPTLVVPEPLRPRTTLVAAINVEPQNTTAESARIDSVTTFDAKPNQIRKSPAASNIFGRLAGKSTPFKVAAVRPLTPVVKTDPVADTSLSVSSPNLDSAGLASESVDGVSGIETKDQEPFILFETVQFDDAVPTSDITSESASVETREGSESIESPPHPVLEPEPVINAPQTIVERAASTAPQAIVAPEVSVDAVPQTTTGSELQPVDAVAVAPPKKTKSSSDLFARLAKSKPGIVQPAHFPPQKLEAAELVEQSAPTAADISAPAPLSLLIPNDGEAEAATAPEELPETLAVEVAAEAVAPEIDLPDLVPEAPQPEQISKFQEANPAEPVEKKKSATLFSKLAQSTPALIQSAQRPLPKSQFSQATGNALPVPDTAGAPIAPPKHSRTVVLDTARLTLAGTVDWTSDRTPVMEELRLIKRRLLRRAFDCDREQNPRSHLVMITSAKPREGKTFAAMNIAISISLEEDYNVLLVDADIRRQALRQNLGLEASQGFVDLLLNPQLDMADVLLRTNIPRLSVLPAGTLTDRAPELLASSRMRELIDDIAQRYPDRIILFDTAPCLVSSDAATLAAHVGQVVFVVEAEQTQQHEIIAALNLISACPDISFILNKAQPLATTSYGGYGAY